MKRTAFILASIALLLSAAGGAFLTLNLGPLGIARADGGNPVLTYKGDNYRTGQNTNETVLNTSNVNVNQFGKRVTYPVDGQVYAEPLFMPGLTINGTTHNVVFVVTEHDSVYAFDADQTTPTQPLWHTSYLTNGATPVANTDVACNDMVPEIGITGTPVIDKNTNTMYLVAFTKENGNLVYRLHAVDITTGLDKTGSPITIQGSVTGTGQGSVNGKVAFNPHYERQRSALLLDNGQIYMSFGSFCDNAPYHGWIMSYNSQLQQTAIYNNTPNGLGGGIWGAGNALAADDSGNIYTISGNGDFNMNTGGPNLGDAFIKLNPQLQVLDYFEPFNQVCLQQADADLGSGGPLLIPGTNLHIGAGKEGRIYVVNDSNMGKYTVDPNLSCAATSTERQRTNIDKVVQELPPGTMGGDYSTPAYWNGTVYFTGANDHIKAFSFSNGTLSSTPISQTPETFTFTGGGSVISSNSTAPNTGILWTIDPHTIALRAYDATNLSKELYNSTQNSSRDKLDSFVKFTVPTVADGEVFVPTQTSLTIYGLLPTTTPTPTATSISTPGPISTPTPSPTAFNNAGISNDTAPGSANFDGARNSYSTQTLQNVGLNGGDNAFYNNMVFTWPDAISGAPDNYIPRGQTIPVTPVGNANILGFLGSSTGGPSSGKATINYTDGSRQTITIGFSDWTLGGGKNPISFGNGEMETLPYRNTPNGQQLVTCYIFYTDTAMQTGKIPQSVTLPTTTIGGTMHIFAIATKAGTVATNPSPSVAYNNVGTSDDRAPGTGNFDGKNSYSSQATQAAGLIPGASVNVYGTTFNWPAADPAFANNYAARGQVIPVTPLSNAGTLAFLGSSTGGNTGGIATVTYTDGSTQKITLVFNDWALSAGNVSTSSGNLIAISTPYRNTPTGKQTMNTYMFYSEFALQAGKTLQSVTLPNSNTIGNGVLHVFAISTRAGAPYTIPPYNNISTSNDNNPSAGKLDGKYSYSAQALQQAGVRPGNNIYINGSTFIWPGAPAGTSNDYTAQGQVVPVNAVYGSSIVAFLGSATNGVATGKATINYADGTTQTVNLGFSDWTLSGGKATLATGSTGNKIALTMSYRNMPTGKQTMKTYVFYQEVQLQFIKPVKSVTLPSTTTGGTLHIFAIATH
jgi:hypothetical protein